MPKTRHLRKARPRIQRAFLKWLDENQTRFLTAPPRLGKRTDRHLELILPGLNPVLWISLTWEIDVGVDWQSTCWDLLTCFEFEAIPEPTEGGYRCKLCSPEFQKIFPTREALWIDHEFEPFLEWVNTVLLHARWLALYGEADSGTWAKLVDEPDPEAAATVPVWVDRAPEQASRLEQAGGVQGGRNSTANQGPG